MTLSPGTRLGPYEILSSLGAGSMGVVYRARDTHLQRTVALKVLNEERRVLGASDLLLGEARAASALNHPNICTVHEVREEAGHVFIVMEYVDGRPLHEQIPVNGLPVDSLTRYAVQMADALAHAHEHGVLHRDLKTANVMTTKDGRTKLVDFGLASRFAPASHEEATRSNRSVYDSGSMAGTLAYMAPEVIQGDPPSVASDLWSFGILLYEMATGHLPFSGRTVFDVSAAILRAPLPALPTHVPASLRMIIMRCLAKEPSQRYQTAGEVRAAIEAVNSDVPAIRSIPPVMPPTRVGWRRIVVGIVAAMVAAVVLLSLVWRFQRERVPTSDAGSGRLVQVLSSERIASEPALSSDGAMIAYVAEDDTGRVDLFVSRVAGGGRVRLTNDDSRETRPRFSPDGERIVFARRAAASEPDICMVPALGGDVSVIVHGGSQPVWSPDGQRIAFVRYEEGGKQLVLATARADGTDIRRLLPDTGKFLSIRAPAWSPDGRSVTFILGSGGVSGNIWLIDADGRSAPKRLSFDSPAVFSDDPAFSADGRAIVHSSNRGGATNIWMLPITGGSAVRLTNGAGPDESPTVDAHGRVAFSNSRWRNELIIYQLGTRTPRSIFRYTPYLWGPAFSPVGPDIAFSRGEVDGAWHIWTMQVDTGSPRQLTNTDRGEIYPRWTPDGQFILFNTWAEPRQILRVGRDGGPPVPLTPANLDAAYGDLSPDGRTLAFAATEGSKEHIYLMSIEGPKEPRLLMTEPASVPRWSPDGKWITFAANRGYYGGVSIVRHDGTGQRRLTNTGGWPVWWDNGNRLGYVTINEDLKQQIHTVTLDGKADPDVIPIRFGGYNDPFDVSRDGRWLATTNQVHVSSEIWVLEGRP